MTRRFFSETPLAKGEVVLSAEESRHLATVLRGAPGDRVEVVDGRGRVAEAVVAVVDRREARLDVGADPVEAPRGRDLELLCALPRAGSADDVIRIATEVGATRITPLETRRGVHRPSRPESGGGRDRFRAAAIAALKQSKRAWLPAIEAPTNLADFRLGADRVAIFGSLAEDAARFRDVADRVVSAPSVVVIVGPEGGFTEDEERAMRESGALPVRLGDGVLRVETAVVALLVLAAEARR